MMATMGLQPASMSVAAAAAAAPKRPAGIAGLDGKIVRPVKRRASKACQCCRSRKVRCNVIEHGAPCTNCRLDQVACIVTESKRKRKSIPSTNNGQNDPTSPGDESPVEYKSPPRLSSKPDPTLDANPLPSIAPAPMLDGHVPHPLYANHHNVAPGTTSLHLVTNHQANGDGMAFYQPASSPQPVAPQVPLYIRPLPQRIGRDELSFLTKKKALDIPNDELRNELLRCYVEFVHPFMPILDLEEVLTIVDRQDGSAGKMSLLLFQAIMYSASSFVGTAHLRRAGFASRKEARRALYFRARHLYEFDYETDRISLLQALLLLTNWFESPDDQKDSWHWMGVATSLAHTIGLNRAPSANSMEPRKLRQWRRMWWTCIIRDRLIALGMRRPTRIKTEDFNVPMLALEDFELAPLSDTIRCLPPSCVVVRDPVALRSFALMCIEKAKLCLIVSHVLQAQYSLPDLQSNAMAAEGAQPTSVLVPKSSNIAEVESCDNELNDWLMNLPQEVQLHLPVKIEASRNVAPPVLNVAVLHLVYYTTLSALHRPQVLAETRYSTVTDAVPAGPARERVRVAANSITDIACGLLKANLARFLPTSGVTVLQPAIISHLLDIKAQDESLQTSGLQGFCQCVQVMSRLRSIYAAADYSLALIEAAVRTASIMIPSSDPHAPLRKANSTEDLVDAGLRRRLVAPVPEPRVLTPPPDSTANIIAPVPVQRPMMKEEASEDTDVARKLGLFLASTPPHSETSNSYPDDGSMSAGGLQSTPMPALDREFESLINLDDFGDAYTFADGGLTGLQGESSGFTFDMDWLQLYNAGNTISRPKSSLSMFAESTTGGMRDDDNDDDSGNMGDIKIPI